MGSKGAVRPPKLAPGSRIALVAPAGPLVERDDATRAAELCRALGWVPTIAPHALEKYGYLAGGDAARLADLNAALTAPDVDGVWCIRGGYGITRLLDRVDFAGFAARPRRPTCSCRRVIACSPFGAAWPRARCSAAT